MADGAQLVVVVTGAPATGFVVKFPDQSVTVTRICPCALPEVRVHSNCDPGARPVALGHDTVAVMCWAIIHPLEITRLKGMITSNSLHSYIIALSYDTAKLTKLIWIFSC